MPMIFNRHVSKRAIWLAALAAAFVVVWHERDTIHEIAQQAFETNVLLDAEDANQRCTVRSKVAMIDLGRRISKRYLKLVWLAQLIPFVWEPDATAVLWLGPQR